MGQYQQWLLAQEIDRRLKAEIETLETELLYLQDRITILELAVPQTENVILQALLAHLGDQAIGGQQGMEQEQGQNDTGKHESRAQAQPDWSGLPKVETPQVLATESAPYFSAAYPQMGRVPEDMLAFFEERRQTDSRLSAWRPGESKKSAERNDEEHPVDAETQRLNESIQRWFERWHRQMTNVAQPEEVQDE